MILDFFKYQGSGNDFIMIDGRKGLNISVEIIKRLCDRHFGVGSDGILVIDNSENADFKMIFYNPDGSRATFCGNGARCIVKFANYLKIINQNAHFVADDGIHYSEIIDNLVKLKMTDVQNVKLYEDLVYINTGTHHVMKFVENIDEIDIINEAKPIRYSSNFEPAGTNVNFVQKINKNTLKIRTYEKGVENETLSCGTGTVASALAYFLISKEQTNCINVYTKGGLLKVDFNSIENNCFKDIYLTGAAEFVFSGKIDF